MKKSGREIIGFDDRLLMIIGIPLVSVLMTLMMFGSRIDGSFLDQTFRCSLISGVYTILFWVAFRQVLILSRRLFPKNKDVKKRIFFNIVTLFSGYYILKFGMHLLLDDFLHTSLNVPKPPGLPMTIGSLTVIFAIFGVYESIYFFNQLEKSLVEKEQLERENILSQLEGLKNQVNPHFLFNSLNTLSHIIPEDSDKAVRFVQQLSKVYRYILEIKEKKLICLSEELSFLNSYIFLLKERFGENLHVEVNIDEKYLEHKIVPLSLQILFENAIKHNIISSAKPLTIEVFIENGKKLIVKNNLQKKNQVMNSTKVGLQNIKNRYQFLSDKLVEVIITARSFIVSIPLLKTNQ